MPRMESYCWSSTDQLPWWAYGVIIDVAMSDPHYVLICFKSVKSVLHSQLWKRPRASASELLVLFACIFYKWNVYNTLSLTFIVLCMMLMFVYGCGHFQWLIVYATNHNNSVLTKHMQTNGEKRSRHLTFTARGSTIWRLQTSDSDDWSRSTHGKNQNIYNGHRPIT